jgi:hypothetical protein
MGATRDDFIKYPRTPHLFGSKGTDDDKLLGNESEAFSLTRRSSWRSISMAQSAQAGSLDPARTCERARDLAHYQTPCGMV